MTVDAASIAIIFKIIQIKHTYIIVIKSLEKKELGRGNRKGWKTKNP